MTDASHEVLAVRDPVAALTAYGSLGADVAILKIGPPVMDS